jgi:UPF0755 protein
VSRPYQGISGEITVEFPRGTGTRGMARELAAKGVIPSELSFLAARALRPTAKLQAGEYLFKEAATPLQVLDRLARGDIFYHVLAVPEGSNLFDIAEEVGKLGWVSKDDFLKVARDPALIKDLAPKAPTLEGYLFPSTYRLVKGTSARQIAKIMTDQFRKTWKSLPGSNNAPVHEMATLASLVEKETAVPGERKLVASVYRNRIDKGMKLECDPTTIYAAMLDGRWRGTIYLSDLKNANPYNTYQNEGLPPGPIANAGAASLEAALQPAKTEYVFFVAKPGGAGSHTFSTDLAGHNRAVAEYRRGQQAVKAR